jgi:hypothetical protein
MDIIIKCHGCCAYLQREGQLVAERININGYVYKSNISFYKQVSDHIIKKLGILQIPPLLVATFTV